MMMKFRFPNGGAVSSVEIYAAVTRRPAHWLRKLSWNAHTLSVQIYSEVCNSKRLSSQQIGNRSTPGADSE